MSITTVLNHHNAIYNKLKSDKHFMPYMYQIIDNDNFRKSKYIIDHIKNNKIIIDILDIDGFYFLTEETFVLLIHDKYINNYSKEIIKIDFIRYFQMSLSTTDSQNWHKQIILNCKITNVKNIDSGRIFENHIINNITYNIQDIVEFNITKYNPKDHILHDSFYTIIDDLKTQISELKNEINDIKSNYDIQILKLKNEITNLLFKDININNSQKNKELCDMIKLNDYQ